MRCFLLDGWQYRHLFRDMLIHGDSRAAVVMSTSPLLVACYSDDADGVCLLRFPPELAEQYKLQTGSRLLTVLNTMWERWHLFRPTPPAADLVQGEYATAGCINFWPLVGDFLTDDAKTLALRKAAVPDQEYDRCRHLGEQHLKQHGGLARNGLPDRSGHAAIGRWF